MVRNSQNLPISPSDTMGHWVGLGGFRGGRGEVPRSRGVREGSEARNELRFIVNDQFTGVL